MEESVYRPEFVEALMLLSRVCRILSVGPQKAPLPILVGGAVVEFDTGGAFMSGDFDFVTEADEAFIAALEQVGFVQDRRPGRLQRLGGWVHPELLIGVDMVSGTLFDGRTDRSRIRLVAVGAGEICMPPTEDMIADRMGQWEASGRRDRSMLEQARAMLMLADKLDDDYLERRIREESSGLAGASDVLTADKEIEDGQDHA